MVSSNEESSSSEETKSANSEYGASWQQDSDEEDLMSSEGSSPSPYKRQRTSSLPTTHKVNILAPTYPNVPVVNSSSVQNPWPYMCPPWMQNPWMYAQQMPMSPPWTTMGAQPAVMSYNAPWMQVWPSPPWTMGAQPAVMSYNTPWMQASPTQWVNLKDYGGNGSQMKAEKRVKARKHVKNVSNVGRKAEVRKVVKLKKKSGNHLRLTEKTERLQASLQASEGNYGQKKSVGGGSIAARLTAAENRQTEIEGNLSKALANTKAMTEALHEVQSMLVKYMSSNTKTTRPMAIEI